MSKLDLVYYEFTDYRDLLLYAFKNLKKTHSKFSYEYCAQKTHCSKSYLINLLQKRRNTTLSKLLTINRFLNLSSEVSYLCIFLFMLGSTEDPVFKKFIKSLLINLKSLSIAKQRGAIHKNYVLGLEKKTVQSHFLNIHNFLIYSLAQLNFVAEPVQILKKLRLKKEHLKEVETALAALVENEIIATKDGRLVPLKKYENSFALTMAEELKLFLPFHFFASEALMDNDQHRPFSLQFRTFALNDQAAKKAVDLYNELYVQLEQLEREGGVPDNVYIMTNNFFRQSED